VDTPPCAGEPSEPAAPIGLDPSVSDSPSHQAGDLIEAGSVISAVATASTGTAVRQAERAASCRSHDPARRPSAGPEEDPPAAAAPLRPPPPSGPPAGRYFRNPLGINDLRRMPPPAPTMGVRVYGYRDYDPPTGRWPSRDPIAEQDDLNLYSFTRNSPAAKFDKHGLVSVGWSPVSKPAIHCDNDQLWAGFWFQGVDMKPNSKYLLTIKTFGDINTQDCSGGGWSGPRRFDAGFIGADEITFAEWIHSDASGRQSTGHRTSNITYFGILNFIRSAGIREKCFHIRIFLEVSLYEESEAAIISGSLPYIPWPKGSGWVSSHAGVYSYGISEGHGAYIDDPSKLEGLTPVFGPHKRRIHLHGSCCAKSYLHWYTDPAMAARYHDDGGPPRPAKRNEPEEFEVPEEGSTLGEYDNSQEEHDRTPGWLPAGWRSNTL